MDGVCVFVFVFYLFNTWVYTTVVAKPWGVAFQSTCSTFLCAGVMPCVTGLPPCNSALLMSPHCVLPCYSLHSSPPSSPQFVSFSLCFCSLLFRANCRHYITCFSLLKGWADTVKNSSNSNKNAPSALSPLYDTSWSDFITGKVYLLCVGPSPAGDIKHTLKWSQDVTSDRTRFVL